MPKSFVKRPTSLSTKVVTVEQWPLGCEGLVPWSDTFALNLSMNVAPSVGRSRWF